MHITVDARGIPCPRPRQMTIEAIRLAKQGETIVVLVSRAAARDSVIRVVKAFQLPCKSQKKTNYYEVHITREKLWMEK
jgi:TusA-related sulfurtransferase